MTGARLPVGDLVAWLALRRVSRGGVAAGHGAWFDGGHPLPCELAAALPTLVDSGYVVLAPADVFGSRPASLTIPRGRERLADLTAREADGELVEEGSRGQRGQEPPASWWAVSTFDDRAHAVAPESSRAPRGRVALCGLVLDSSVAWCGSPDGVRVCGTCGALAVVEGRER